MAITATTTDRSADVFALLRELTRQQLTWSFEGTTDAESVVQRVAAAYGAHAEVTFLADAAIRTVGDRTASRRVLRPDPRLARSAGFESWLGGHAIQGFQGLGDMIALMTALAAAYGDEQAHISRFPTLLIVSLGDGEPAGIRTIDNIYQLPLDHTSEVFAIARRAQAGEPTPSEAQAALDAALVAPPRFGTVAYIASHGMLTIGIGLLIHPAAVELWVYAALGVLVGAIKAWARRYATAGHCSPSWWRRSCRRSPSWPAAARTPPRCA
jgi:uncharacterized membrane protein YjjP (DUF1212 family)